MNRGLAVLRYEAVNVLRSRWLYAYTGILILFTAGFRYLIDDVQKADLALINVLIPLIPLVSVLFTTVYWYNAQRFTELLLAQPVSRATLFGSRVGALLGCLTICLAIGVFGSAALNGGLDGGALWLFLGAGIAGVVFTLFGALISTFVADRMWGIGLGFGLWFYFIAMHDALLLLMLYWFRDYSLQELSMVMTALNPLALIRVVLLMHFDAPLLLGHAGAIVRRTVESGSGYSYAAAVLLVWMLVPSVLGLRGFLRRDF